MSEYATTPSWVAKRDGRVVPFEGDKICRAVFAVTEELGRPDAFLARELTDGVLHFLADDLDGRDTATTAQIADTVVKVVRELGHPALAQAFRQHAGTLMIDAANAAPAPSDEAARQIERCPAPHRLTQWLASDALCAYSLRAVYPRDLLAARAAELLTLGELDAPLELAGGMLDPPTAGDWFEALETARERFGRYVVFDGLEYALASSSEAATSVRELRLGLRTTGLRAVVNLNTAEPPAWATPAAAGPLFAGLPCTADAGRRCEVADALLDTLLDPTTEPTDVRVDWHLGPSDFTDAARPRLLRLAAKALTYTPLTFVFDRPRRPVALAEGLDRRQPAALLTVGLHLPRLAEQVVSAGDPATAAERFLAKLGSLARLTLGAGHARQDYLRRFSRPAATRGFLLERSRLVAVPVGLEATARLLGADDAGAWTTLACQMIARLRGALAQDRPRGLAAGLDSVPAATQPVLSASPPGPPATLPSVAGLTTWDDALPPRRQLRANAALQGEAGAGTATVLFPADRSPTAADVADLLDTASQMSGLVRVRFARSVTSGP